MNRTRILLLADTHLGFDFPLRPRIERRRRGDDFFRVYESALETARREDVDAVIHGGDLFHRSRVPSVVLYRAFEPLVALAEAGVRVYIVPGNHERSVIPNSLFSIHERIEVFEAPRTVTHELGGNRVSLSGFPSIRNGIRESFPSVLAGHASAVGNTEDKGAIRILCMHQTVEGSRVGVSDFMFRNGSDVIPRRVVREITGGGPKTEGAVRVGPMYDLIVSGHIHRHQVLDHGSERSGSIDFAEDFTPLPPGCVIYPGAIERTAFDERNEKKGCVLIEIEAAPDPVIRYRFVGLPARPMVSLDIPGTGDAATILLQIRLELTKQPSDSVVRIRLTDVPTGRPPAISEKTLREIAPKTMNVTLSIPELRSYRSTT